jgi:anti-sigma B factor antagonist
MGARINRSDLKPTVSRIVSLSGFITLAIPLTHRLRLHLRWTDRANPDLAPTLLAEAWMKCVTIATHAAGIACIDEMQETGRELVMEIPVDRVDSVSVAVIPVEELDAVNASEFKRDIAPILQANQKVVLDMAQLRFVDSSGLGAMLSCLRLLNAKGGDLKLCGMSSRVRALFEIVRMHRIFDIYGTKDEAVKAFQP